MDTLMWISRSERPMTTEELCAALGVEIGSNDINSSNIPPIEALLASCLGLVTVDERSRVRFLHFTFQEYLNGHPEYFENPCSVIAEVCLTYLNYDSVNKLSPTLRRAPKEAPLLQYASNYWGLFARNGMTEGVKSLALQLLNDFDRHISAQLLLYGKGFTGLHCAAYFGLEEIVAILEMRGWDMCMAHPRSYTALLLAARNGHEGVVKLLLARRELNPNSSDEDGIALLLGAAQNGHEGIVRLLLARSEVNPGSSTKNGSIPLQQAVQNGHKGIVKLFLARSEVNPDPIDRDGYTPLLSAAEDGHEGIVKQLRDHANTQRDTNSLDSQTSCLPDLLVAVPGASVAPQPPHHPRDISPGTPTPNIQALWLPQAPAARQPPHQPRDVSADTPTQNTQASSPQAILSSPLPDASHNHQRSRPTLCRRIKRRLCCGFC